MQEYSSFSAFRRAVRSEPLGIRQFRALFISDVHLGAGAPTAERLLDFFKRHDADRIYLVGDIVDVLALKRARRWPAVAELDDGSFEIIEWGEHFAVPIVPAFPEEKGS